MPITLELVVVGSCCKLVDFFGSGLLFAIHRVRFNTGKSHDYEMVGTIYYVFSLKSK